MTFRIALFSILLLLLGAASAEERASMVVGLEEARLRCSGGSELGWSVGDQVQLTRSGEVVGWAQVQEVGQYQTWLSAEGVQAQVGDKVQKADPAQANREYMMGRKLTFKAKLSGQGGGGVNQNDVWDVFGLYNLIDNQRFARRFGDGFYRTSADIDLAVGVAGFLFNQFARRRGPRIQPAEAQFGILMDRRFKEMSEGAVEIELVIHNSGFHELKFDKLGEHMFLEDRHGERVEFYEMSSELLESLMPGETVTGLVRFQEAELGSRIKFRFENVLGQSKSAKF